MNSSLHRSARLDMLNGRKPAACRGCYQSEALGVESKRQRENKTFKSFSAAHAAALTDADGRSTAALRFVELRLGNLCNLKCRTCNPASSSKWTQEYRELQNRLGFVRKYALGAEAFAWPEREEFWTSLDQASGNLEMIYINGGEPTLIERHWDFLAGLVERSRAKSVELIYNINMTHLPERAFEIWREFKKVHVGASIDDVGARNTYIRHPSAWDRVVANLRRLRDSGVSVGITQTVSALNFYYLDALSDFAKAEGVGLGHNFVYDPEFMSPEALPQAVRLSALDRLSGRLPGYLMEPLRKQFSGADRAELWSQFKRYTFAIDELRKENFADVFPELVGCLRSHGIAWENA